MRYQHTHNAAACPDCVACTQRWGPGHRCDKVHDLREGDVVTVGNSTKPWLVSFAGDVVVTAIDPGGRYHSFGRGCPRPLSELTPVGHQESA